MTIDRDKFGNVIPTDKVGIYYFLCKLNNMGYIGKTIDSLFGRINNHRYTKPQEIDYAIKDFGFENFDIEIIEEYEPGTITNDELLALETAYIVYFNTLKPNGYNGCLFSMDRTGIPLSEEHKKKLSIINMGKYIGEKSGTWGRKHTDIEKAKMKITRAKQDMSFKKVAIKQIDKTTSEVIKIWDSSTEAAIQLFDNLNAKNHIWDACNHRIKSAYGFKWEYVENQISPEIS